MKLDELEATMKVVKLPKPGPMVPRLALPPAPAEVSGGPAEVEKVLEGEVVDSSGDKYMTDFEYSLYLLDKFVEMLRYLGDPKLVQVIQIPDRKEINHFVSLGDAFLEDVAEEDEEDEDIDQDEDIKLGCPQCEFNIMASSTEATVCPDCENHPELMDMKELELGPPDDPAFAQEEPSDVPNMNRGNCKNLIHSSCVMAVARSEMWCAPCKKWYADFHYEGEKDGVLLADDGDLTPKEWDRLNAICGQAGVEI